MNLNRGSEDGQPRLVINPSCEDQKVLGWPLQPLQEKGHASGTRANKASDMQEVEVALLVAQVLQITTILSIFAVQEHVKMRILPHETDTRIKTTKAGSTSMQRTLVQGLVSHHLCWSYNIRI